MDDDQQDVFVETPLGKLRARGVRVSDLIGLVTLCICGAILYFVLSAHDSVAEQRRTTLIRYSELGAILKAQVQSQRLMTCIISMPDVRRQQEYADPNSWCRAISMVQ